MYIIIGYSTFSFFFVLTEYVEFNMVQKYHQLQQCRNIYLSVCGETVVHTTEKRMKYHFVTLSKYRLR